MAPGRRGTPFSRRGPSCRKERRQIAVIGPGGADFRPEIGPKSGPFSGAASLGSPRMPLAGHRQTAPGRRVE